MRRVPVDPVRGGCGACCGRVCHTDVWDTCVTGGGALNASRELSFRVKSCGDVFPIVAKRSSMAREARTQKHPALEFPLSRMTYGARGLEAQHVDEHLRLSLHVTEEES